MPSAHLECFICDSDDFKLDVKNTSVTSSRHRLGLIIIFLWKQLKLENNYSSIAKLQNKRTEKIQYVIRTEDSTSSKRGKI